MSSFAQHFTEDRRLTILRLLDQAPEYTANTYILQSMLAQHGHSVAQDRVKTDLAWLSEQGLLTVTETNGVTVAQLNARGVDVAAGRSTVPGIKRPVPGD